MISNPQRAAKAIGATGCYFLSICSIAERLLHVSIDPLLEYEHALLLGTLGDDCMVRDAGGLLSSIVHERWVCRKAGPGHELPATYQCRQGEFEILRYERARRPTDGTSSELAHFVLGDGRSHIDFDPWGDSETVRTGSLVSRRIFTQAP
jgi:hypothetical protein